MSDADLLLEAIWANPDDDTPRLAYADWLEEHGHAVYARYIRLSVRVAREMQHPDERARLRLERLLLGTELGNAHPRTFREGGGPLHRAAPDPHGIATPGYETGADEFLKNWPRWWPFIRPKRLSLYAAAGHELALGRCEYLRRVEALVCGGHVGIGFGLDLQDADRVAVSGILLRALADSPHTERLTALKVGPIAATPAELLDFGESALAARLEELHLWVQFPDGSREHLRARIGMVRIGIVDFVHGFRDHFGSPGG